MSSSTLLGLWGWKLPNKDELTKIKRNDTGKTIIIISHTSYWDFFLLMLYRQSEPVIGKNLYLVVKPQAFKYWGWFLEPMGCIPATRSEDRGGGFVDKTTRNFRGKNFRIVISPEGKLVSSEWRSGYYYLAKNLKASIMVAGLDYKNKKLWFGKRHSYDEIISTDYMTLQNELIKEMGQITPLYPQNSYANLKTNSVINKFPLRAVDDLPLFLTILFVVSIVISVVIIIYYVCRRRN